MQNVARQNVEVIDAPKNNALTPMDMLDRAIATGAGIDVLSKLMELNERWDRNQARKAFDQAMAEAKAEIPVILKNRTVDFTSAKGRTNYRHEDFAEIARTVDPILSKHGLSYRFRTTSAANEPVTVTCIVSHRLGHFEENTLSAGRDDSGNKNGIQAIGSTQTYLQRYTLKAALGLAASTDDDAAKAETGTLTPERVTALQTLIDDAGVDIAKVCAFMKVDALADIDAKDFPKAVDAIGRYKAKVAAAKVGGAA
jgi:hypothetical protein